MTNQRKAIGTQRAPVDPRNKHISWRLGGWSVQPARCALIIAGVFVALGIVYSLSSPVLEASDEFKHYPYVQYVQTRHRLPILDPDVCRESLVECPWLQDGAQPPSYYILMAAATSWIDTSDLPELLWHNKHAFIGNPTQICNKNLIIHQPERERFPWTGSVLAVHLIRFLTLGFGAGTVLLTYRVARVLFPDRPGVAVGASALTAFNPMFVFVNATVNNDAMAAFVGSLALLTIVRVVDGGSSTPPTKLTRQSLLLGLIIGLGVLTKLSLLALIPLACLVVVVETWRRYGEGSERPRWAVALLHVLLIVLPAAAISSWWFFRNWQLYGDPTALNAFIAVQGRRAQAPVLRDWLGEFGTFRWTYWSLFGAVNVMAPRPVYWLFDLLSLFGAVGFGLWTARRFRKGWTGSDYRVLIPALWALMLFVSVLRWTWVFFSFQGRLMFPGIAGISTLTTLGLRQWWPRRCRREVTVGVSAILLVIAALLPFVAIRPAYVQPEPLALSQVPESDRIEPTSVGAVARVVGVDYEPQSIDPENKSGFVNVVVYWQAVEPEEKDYVSFARLLGRGHELAGQINRHPACGMVPTSLWRPGQIWRDPYRIPVAQDARAPSVLRIEVGLYDPQADYTLGSMRIGQAKLAPADSQPDIGHPLSVKLDDGISLEGYDLAPADVSAGETLTLTLHWRAREAPSHNYQVFAHVLGDDPEPVTQADGPPLMGDYPTSMWAAGESISDPHSILIPEDLSAGRYRLLVGLYDLETMERLSRTDGSGTGTAIPFHIGVD